VYSWSRGWSGVQCPRRRTYVHPDPDARQLRREHIAEVTEFARGFEMLEELNPAEVEAERTKFGPLPE
jgi:hypothetical protein